ncbi:MAG: hypothetical protein JJ992_27285 [Planctomycetes bacterium]|nr:hypothetical protein [Planctomycetota bacterium]
MNGIHSVDSVARASAVRPVPSRAAAWLLQALLLVCGCTKLDLQNGLPLFKEDPKPEAPDRMVAVWAHALMTKAGEPSTRGFGGRIMFFASDEDDPVLVDGKLTVYAFDDEVDHPDQQIPEKKFVFPRDGLAGHQSESKLGPSYSFWLPWDQMEGKRRRITLIGRFEDASGRVILSQAARVLLPGKGDELALQVSKRESPPPVEDATIRPASYVPRENLSDQLTAEAAPESRSRMETTTIPITPGFANRLLTASEQPSDRSAPAPAGERIPATSASRSTATKANSTVPQAQTDSSYQYGMATGTQPSIRSAPDQSQARSQRATQPSFDPVRRRPIRGEWLRPLPPTPRTSWSRDQAELPEDDEGP